MPATGNIYMRAAGHGTIDGVSVVRVTGILQEGIVPASLLSHVLEEEVGAAGVHIRRDVELRGLCIAGPQVVGARARVFREIETVGMRKRAVAAEVFSGFCFEHDSRRAAVDQF